LEFKVKTGIICAAAGGSGFRILMKKNGEKTIYGTPTTQKYF
jgi:hypothetical protein